MVSLHRPSCLSRLLSWFLLSALAGPAVAGDRPLKVYILAGQSNMEGHAKVETFDYIGDDPATAPLLKQMRTADGKSRVCDHVWISYFTGGETNGEGFGKLTAGTYTARAEQQDAGGMFHRISSSTLITFVVVGTFQC